MWQSKHIYTIDWNKFPCFSTFIRHLERRFPVSNLERCPACHPERSEGSDSTDAQILRCAQDDMYYLQMSTPSMWASPIAPLLPLCYTWPRRARRELFLWHKIPHICRIHSSWGSVSTCGH